MTAQSSDEILIEKMSLIMIEEDTIDEALELYLITWSPDPAQLPDCDFIRQHRYCADTVIEYCKACYSACFCVESTQLGNPHYHGWYQVDQTNDTRRIVLVRLLQKLGNVKITEAKYYKINSYEERKNALYYYKKGIVGPYIMVPYSPISSTTEIPRINWELTSFFDRDIKNPRLITEQLSHIQFMKQFYTDSI